MTISSCTRVSDVDRFSGRVDLLRIVETVPQQGDADVDPGLRLDLCLSAPLDPRSLADPNDVYVTSGEARIDVGVSLELLAWTDRGGVGIEPDAQGPWCAGSVFALAPEVPLTPGLLFRLRLPPFARGWQGEELDTTQAGWIQESEAARYYLEFTVAEDQGDAGSGSESAAGGASESAGGTDVDESDPGPTLTELFADGAVFDPERDVCSCHRDPTMLAFELLELSDPATAYADLVLESRARDTGFAMVSPRRPSESFLVQKLVRADGGQRLRGVLGDAMPPDEPLPYADYVAIARWIEAGAQP